LKAPCLYVQVPVRQTTRTTRRSAQRTLWTSSRTPWSTAQVHTHCIMGTRFYWYCICSWYLWYMVGGWKTLAPLVDCAAKRCLVTLCCSDLELSWFYICMIYLKLCTFSLNAINVSTLCLNWRLLLWQMRESTLRQTLHVRIASDTQKIQSSDWPKWCCTLWCYVNSRLLLKQLSF